MDRLQAELADFQRARAIAETARLQSLLDSHIHGINEAIAQLHAKEQQPHPTAAAAPLPVPVPVSVVPLPQAGGSQELPYQTITTYGWDETDKAIKLYVTLDGCGAVDASQTQLIFGKNSVRFRYNNSATPRQLLLQPLKKEVSDRDSIIKCKTGEVVITIKKKETGKWWELLEKTAVAKTAAAATSSGADADADGAADPGAGLMKLMKQMYDDGDDEMKRTIGKAWTESREKQAKGEM